jgi:hypothetical protein
MIYNLLINPKVQGEIDTIMLDAVLEEHHDITNQVTEFPVEDGYNISDHVIPKPMELRLQATITNSPMLEQIDQHALAKQNALIHQYAPQLAGVSGTSGTSGQTGDRVMDAYSELCILAGFPAPATKDQNAPIAPTLITVTTGFRVYTQMIISRLSVPRRAEDGDSITFEIEFKRVRIVNTQTSPVSNASELNGIAPNVNHQAAVPVKINNTQNSIATITASDIKPSYAPSDATSFGSDLTKTYQANPGAFTNSSNSMSVFNAWYNGGNAQAATYSVPCFQVAPAGPTIGATP